MSWLENQINTVTETSNEVKTWMKVMLAATVVTSVLSAILVVLNLRKK